MTEFDLHLLSVDLFSRMPCAIQAPPAVTYGQFARVGQGGLGVGMVMLGLTPNVETKKAARVFHEAV